jgi:pimeloyl-ACP methyl ester carboxylesterase
MNKSQLRNEIETEAGIRRVDFIRRGSSSLFASLELPRGEPREGIVICSSINADHSKLYSAEVRLGATLAAEGFAVVRFHYRGQGHSDGDASDITFESLRDDALAATEYLQSEADVPGVSFIGSRIGALIAGAVSAAHADSRLVLWEPIVDPIRYVREALRSMSMARMSGGRPDSGAGDPMGSRGDAPVDVHGFPIHKRFVSSLEGRALTFGDDPRALLLVQISRSRELSAPYAALMGEWRREGRSADSCCVIGAIAWWFRGMREGREETESVTAEVISATVDWLSSSPDIAKGLR